MGNKTSSPQNENSSNVDSNQLKPKSLGQILDYIATYYILTMDFKSLKQLYQKEYCDKLVILTSEIIDRYFTDLEIEYLAQRIKDGEEVNETAKANVVFFDKDELTKLDIQNSIKKKRICVSIAKFYIKIAHLFASIVTTINPTYVYKDNEGNVVKADLFEKGKIPKGTPREIYKLNICSNRINSLRNNQDYDNVDNNSEVLVGPKFCEININSSGEDKRLDEEPGIPELMDLYYDDNYDADKGIFTGMSEQSKNDFQQDLRIFYQVFTGNKDVPPEIQKFSDIKLRDYKKMPKCQGDDPIFNRKVKGKLSEKLFFEYADNIRQMINKTNKSQQELLEIINQIFVYTIDTQTNKKQIRVNPKLTEVGLQELIVKSRGLIIQLYLSCENDYITGLKIYEAIVEQKIIETTQNQIQNLEKLQDSILSQEKLTIPEPAETREVEEIKEQKIEEQKNEIEKINEQIEEESTNNASKTISK
jgi:hypothetical protein